MDEVRIKVAVGIAHQEFGAEWDEFESSDQHHYLGCADVAMAILADEIYVIASHAGHGESPHIEGACFGLQATADELIRLLTENPTRYFWVTDRSGKHVKADFPPLYNETD